LKVLLDHNLSEHLQPLLTGHIVFAARAMGWDRLENGELLRAAEAESFDAMLTGDTGLFYQQNNKKRRIALIVLRPPDWQIIRQNVPSIQDAISRATPVSYEVLNLIRP
jgi:hypothetical protein